MGLRVMLVGKQAKARLNLRIFLRSCSKLDFVGEAASSAETMLLCGRVRPDVILLSLTCAEISLLPLMRVLRHQYPATQIVVFSHLADDYVKDQALYHGATQYLPCRASRDHLINALCEAAAALQAVG